MGPGGQRRPPPANGQQSRQRPPGEKVALLVGSASAGSIQKVGEAKRSLQNIPPLERLHPFQVCGGDPALGIQRPRS